MLPIILGSQSPRRKEILDYFCLPFVQAVSYFDESSVPYKGDALAYAAGISEGKALALKERYRDNPILTADTIVVVDGKLYGKPSDEEEARRFLADFSGRWQQVFTAVTILMEEKLISKVEETRVLMNVLTDHEINRYLQTANWRDKAGGYSIQNKGGLLVKEIQGCYYNVLGFPINTVQSLLKHIGIDLWSCLKEG